MKIGFEYCKVCFSMMRHAKKADRNNPVKKYWCRPCREYRFLDTERNRWVSLRHQPD